MSKIEEHLAVMLAGERPDWGVRVVKSLAGDYSWVTEGGYTPDENGVKWVAASCGNYHPEYYDVELLDKCSEIIELVESQYGSGKAMQVADILKEGE